VTRWARGNLRPYRDLLIGGSLMSTCPSLRAGAKRSKTSWILARMNFAHATLPTVAAALCDAHAKDADLRGVADHVGGALLAFGPARHLLVGFL